MTLLENVRQALAEAGISPESGLLAVALSGGADSVCLLLALKELGFSVHALHCNFELRATESDADEAFCRRLCRQHELPVSVRHFRTRSYAQRHGISVEMAARDLRYGWFAEQLRALGAVALCVAHHRDDNIETMLLNLIRGTGIHGLTGMKVSASLPVASRSEQAEPLQLLRPLLAVSRSDIEAWLHEREQPFVTDSSNLDADAAQRNTVRLRLLPLMEELNPRVRANLAATIDRLGDAEALYADAVARQRADVETDEGIDIGALRKAIAPQTILFEILRDHGFSAEQAVDVYHHLDGESGHEWKSEHWRLLRDRGRLLWQSVEDDASTFRETTIPLSGLFETPDGTRLLIRRQAIDPASFAIPRDARTACFDLEKLTLPLTIRIARPADRFQPFGMEGTRLVSDLLTDHKLSLFEKERQLVVCTPDVIAWVVGIRAAAGFEVDASTRHVMTITLL
ncbi:MAG: tRNA lysidine(34) synthetase TilS [Bacteroidaceae bacterium]|nr:tRNA lysidine(34) synthetase TilS [Bacteroidaceae bacterium]